MFVINTSDHCWYTSRDADANHDCMQILTDTIDALAEAPQEVVQRPEGTSEANVVDVCAVALYMFAQLYIRQAQRADAMDVWPSSSPQAAAAAFTVRMAASHDSAGVRTRDYSCAPPE